MINSEKALQMLSEAEFHWNTNKNVLQSMNLLKKSFEIFREKDEIREIRKILKILVDIRVFNKKQNQLSKTSLCELILLTGRVQKSLWYLDEALKNFNQAHKLAEELSNPEIISSIKLNIASVLYQFGSYSLAITECLHILSFSSNLILLNREDLLASAYNNIGACHEAQGRFEKAWRYFYNSLQISKKKNQYLIVAKRLHNIGCIFLKLSDTKRANSLFREAFNIHHQIGSTSGEAREIQASTMLDLRSRLNENEKIKRKQDKNNRMLKYYTRLENEEKITHIKKEIGSYYLEIEECEKGSEYILEALEIYKKKNIKKDIAIIYNNIGGCFRKSGEKNSANEYYQKALAIFRQINDKYNIANSLDNLGFMFYLLKKYSKAEKVLYESFDIKEEIVSQITHPFTRISARKFEIATMDLMVSIELKRGNFNRSQELLELRKNRELNQKSSSAFHLPEDFLTYQKQKYRLYEQMDEVETQWENVLFEKNRDQIDKDQFEHTQKNVVIDWNRLYDQVRSIEDIIWFNFPLKSNRLSLNSYEGVVEEIVKMLPEFKWALLEFFYFITEEILYVFYLDYSSKSKTVLFSLKFTIEEYSELLTIRKDIITKISNYNEKEAEKMLTELSCKMSEFLIPPKLRIKLKRKEIEYLIIIPSDSLHLLPLELIYDGETYWGLKYCCIRSFSKNFLIESLKRTISKLDKKILVFNVPDPQIEEIQEETDAVRTLFTKKTFNVDSPSIKRCTKNQFLEFIANSTYFLIHYIGHGYFNKSDANRSKLVFESENLYAEEFYSHVKLKGSPIVFLNACETGISRIELGDEPLGLIKGLFHAGASCSILSSWEIYGKAPKDFALFFYEKLLAGANIGEAIKYARISIFNLAQKKEYDELNLIHWGTFTLYGNPFQSFTD